MWSWVLFYVNTFHWIFLILSESSSDSSGKEQSESDSEGSEQGQRSPTPEPEVKILSEKEMNELGAKIVKAELMGDDVSECTYHVVWFYYTPWNQ